MSRQPFDVLDFPLNGLRLIEASAGTGKTFSLAGLYLRLLVEKQLDVGDILVMTFTRAATQELRERIRRRIADAARIAADPRRVERGNTEHEIARALIEASDEPPARIARRLREAAARMDDAAIATIHGFAQQAARENAFDSGLLFDRGTQVDDPGVHTEAVADYWRGQVFGQSGAQARAFVELWPEPNDLYEDLKAALERPYVDIRHTSQQTLDELTRNAQTRWEKERHQLRALLETAVERKLLRKNEPLNSAITDHGGVDGLMAHLAAGLAGTASGHPVLPAWIVDLTTTAGVQAHATRKAKDAFRPQDLELVQALAALAPAGRIAALEAALATIRDAIRRRKRDARQFSFADMIESLHGAVTHPEHGETLAAALHRAWPYALVDEFQDTDPQQYDILRAIYRGREEGALIMIGDPKQAIFAFRGGDVFAYLDAARDADGCYELRSNWRSTQRVLDGIETLFRGPAEATGQGEFLVPDIRFHHVDSQRPDQPARVKGGEPIPAVTVWALPGENLTADEARKALIDATASEIYTLLQDGDARMPETDGGERRIRPNDIAVLVSRNRDAAEVQRTLAGHGINAVCLQPDSVFESRQALELLYLLRAAGSAARPEALRAALATPLLGWRMAGLLALAESDADWHEQVARFQDAHETWRTRGVLAMVEPFLQDAAARLLALEDGERRLTNYLQLAELLARAETETFGFAGLIRWLSEQIAHPEPYAEVDSQQLKLESDDELVRITTVHRAKGLEFPIVFAPLTPFLGAREQKHPLLYHDESGHAWLDFSLDDDNTPAAQRESRAEALRLLYVALTRAERACYLSWGAVKTAQNSALAWLLHGEDVDPGDVSAPTSKLPAWLTDATVERRLQDYAERAGDAVRVTEPPVLAEGFRAPPGTAPEGAARDDLPARRPDWSVFSFSRLVAGGRDGAAAAGGADDEVLELPVSGTAPLDTQDTTPAATQIALRGPVFGTAIHRLLETTDAAAWPAPVERPGDDHRALAARFLKNAGLPLGEGAERDALLDGVCRMVSRTLHTPLPGIGPLAHVPAGRHLVEMEFFLGLGGESARRLLETLNDHGYGVTLSPEHAAQTLNGLMQGFIDLTVEADGRYWVVDYKTNDLGTRQADYQGNALARAVQHGHYDLQYLIYLTALHRHLAHTLADYDPARHLGGAQYLFTRGVDGISADAGVYVDSPPAALIVAMDDLLAGRKGSA